VPASALALVLLAGLIHASWNIAAKKAGGDVRFAAFTSIVAPAREISMLFAALIGGQLLGEGDRLLRLLGAGFIAAGVMALALG
jgi:uncharacterized membrane protein